MLLGDFILGTICDLFGESTYAIIKKLIDAMKPLDDELILYALAYMYGLDMFYEDDRIKIKRKIACIDLAKLFNVDHDEERVYIKKPGEDELDKALKIVITKITEMLRTLLGDAVPAFLSYISRKLSGSFRGPNELAIWVSEELSRNPYAPRISVEIKGRIITVYAKYPIEVSEAFLQGTVLPYIIASASALMSNYRGVRLKESNIADKNTIVMVFEAYR